MNLRLPILTMGGMKWDGGTEIIAYMLVWPDFGTMTFDNAVAYTNKGTAVTPIDSGTTSYIVESYYDNNITQNNVTATDSSVAVTWLASGPATQLGANSD